MRALAILTVVCCLFAAESATAQQQAWCEQDCRSLCAKTAAKDGATPAQCVQQYNCAQYAGRACAGPAVVNARAAAYQGGGGRLTFDQCYQRGVRAGWGAAETASYCRQNSR